jgi:hypothetical protein
MIDNLMEGKDVSLKRNSFKNILVSNGLISISQIAHADLPTSFVPYNSETKNFYTENEYRLLQDRIRI